MMAIRHTHIREGSSDSSRACLLRIRNLKHALQKFCAGCLKLFFFVKAHEFFLEIDHELYGEGNISNSQSPGIVRAQHWDKLGWCRGFHYFENLLGECVAKLLRVRCAYAKALLFLGQFTQDVALWPVTIPHTLQALPPDLRSHVTCRVGITASFNKMSSHAVPAYILGPTGGHGRTPRMSFTRSIALLCMFVQIPSRYFPSTQRLWGLGKTERIEPGFELPTLCLKGDRVLNLYKSFILRINPVFNLMLI